MKSLFKRIRFSFRFAHAFLKKHRSLIFLGFLVGLLCFLYLPKVFLAFFSREVRIIGVVGRYSVAEIPLGIVQQISDGLTGIDKEGNIVPAIAKSWEINNNGQEYIFTLDEQKLWHDNTPVFAKDIDFNFSDVTTVALDNNKVKFSLKQPFSPFLSVVSRPLFKKNLVGTGEYRVSRIYKKGQIVERLVLISRSKEKTQKTVYRFYPTEEAAITAFMLGEVNALSQMNHIGDLATWSNVNIEKKVMNDRFVSLFFNTQNPKFAEKSTRQALAYAIEKRWSPRATTPLNAYSWAFNENVKPYNYDLDNAKKLLEKKTENPETSSQEPLANIELSTIPSLLNAAEEIKKDWEKLGITTQIKVISSLDDPYETLLITQEIPLDPDQYIYWHSTQALNLSHYKSPKIDKLLEDGRKTLDQEKRKEIYLDFQKSLVEDTPTVFLFHPTVYQVFRK